MRIIAILIMSLIALCAVSQVDVNTLQLEITGLESTEGKIRVRLINDREEVVMRKVVDVTGTDMKTFFENVPSGTYAVSYYHDANDNGEVDFK